METTEPEERAKEQAKGRRVTVRCPFCLKLNRVDVGRGRQKPRCGECGRPILLDRPVKVVGEDLARVLADAEVPVLVDFYADWCGPCKVMAPVLDELAGERSGELLVAKLDTDANPESANRFGIRGIPTLILFRAGKEVARRSGALSRRELDELLSAD